VSILAAMAVSSEAGRMVCKPTFEDRVRSSDKLKGLPGIRKNLTDSNIRHHLFPVLRVWSHLTDEDDLATFVIECICSDDPPISGEKRDALMRYLTAPSLQLPPS